jgi:hypothetical protein
VHNTDCTPALRGTPYYPAAVEGRRGVRTASQDIAYDIGALGLPGGETRGLRDAAFAIGDNIVASSARSVDDLRSVFPAHNVHPMSMAPHAPWRGWISIDPVGSNRWAFGGARVLVRSLERGFRLRVVPHP